MNLQEKSQFPLKPLCISTKKQDTHKENLVSYSQVLTIWIVHKKVISNGMTQATFKMFWEENINLHFKLIAFVDRH